MDNYVFEEKMDQMWNVNDRIANELFEIRKNMEYIVNLFESFVNLKLNGEIE